MQGQGVPIKCQHMPRPLTFAEYEQMMSELDEAEEWMRDQMKVKSTASILSRSLRNNDWATSGSSRLQKNY